MKNGPFLFIVTVSALFSTSLHAQRIDSPNPFLSFYYDYKIANPAFAGMRDKYTIMSVYSGHPGSDLQMAYGTYELNLKSISSGVGAIGAFEEVGAVSAAHYGLFYNKQVKFSENSGLQIGTQLFYKTEKIDFSRFAFGDGFDPINVKGIEKNSNVNVDLGIVYYSAPITIGGSVKNVIDNDGEKPSLNFIVSRDFQVSEKIKVTPSLLFYTDLKNEGYHLNATIELIDWIMVGAGYTAAQRGRDGDLSFNLGVNIKDWVQVVTHVYSSSEQNRDNAWVDDGQRWMETMIRVRIPHGEN